ncbi:FHA domain-containing protein [Streptomyces sp. ACA25]|uniref:FHA domain-containing protein n=1 Tax=Streptomyces sp. ACA25 TaxID=3022596 RepID=UPI0023080DCD|nr:FHA domain-containing protein [Streptomyces sp. ACA25]MDB1089471.1 FHA domain-containing protein [Streptomyces sp. ACA25]
MQIRLTVLGPQGGDGADVAVSAPADTPLAAVVGALATAAVPGSGHPGAVFCGLQRVDPQRSLLGHPPLVDGAVLSFQRPSETAEPGRAPARLLVLSGPDAGGVHLLHGGEVRIGRSADTEVPLDDPDVSRLHCVLAMTRDGAVTVRDLNSTNGTAVNGVPVGGRPVPLPPGSVLRVGESVLQLLSDSTSGPACAEGGSGTRDETEGRSGDAVVPVVGTDRAQPVGEDEGTVTTRRLPPRPAAGPTAPGARGRAAGRGKLTGWARRLGTGGERPRQPAGPVPAEPAPAAILPEPAQQSPWPDPATLLLTALESGPRLWERDASHRDAFTVRLGTAERVAGPLVPMTVGFAAVGSLGLAGPRDRLTGLARSVLAQLAALHPPSTLELVVLARDRVRDWSWLGWLPHLQPSRGQDCRLLMAFDRAQAAARVRELTDRPAHSATPGRTTVVLVDGDPGGADLRAAVARLASDGPGAGIHVLCLAEAPAATPASPVAETLTAARSSSPAFGACGTVGLLTGEVATTVRLLLPDGTPGPAATTDAVSPAWAERFARALAPLREESPAQGVAPAVATVLPDSCRLLDVLDLPRVTPGALRERWTRSEGLPVVLGAGTAGPVTADLTALQEPLRVSGGPKSGKTELLCSLAASLAAARGPRELSLLLVDGAGDGLRPCEELPQVASSLRATDPVRMRAFARALREELQRRARLLEGGSFAEHVAAGGLTGPGADPVAPGNPAGTEPCGTAPGDGRVIGPRAAAHDIGSGEAADPPPMRTAGSCPLPFLVVLVDDFDILLDPPLGAPGRPAAGSMMRVLQAVAEEGHRLGVRLITTTSLAETDAAIRVVLSGLPAGRAELCHADGTATPLQSGRVTGRIPRTSTLRPTVVPLDWSRAGDPPTRRPVRELGNGPTDVALLASAAARAGRSDAAAAASLV